MNYLNTHNLNIINSFINDKNLNKFLIISGLPNSGKTTLANDILKDTIISYINSSDIKYYKNILNHINNIITKKNITLMFNIPKNRSLLFDDLHVFKKYDRINYNLILNFLVSDNTIKKIITIDPDYISDFNNYYYINLHTNSTSPNQDIFYSNNNILKNLLYKKFNIFDLDNHIYTNDIIIVLCLLELIIYNIPLKYNTCISNIYNNYIIADIYEKSSYTLNLKYLREYILYLTCSSIHYINTNNIYINYTSFNKYNSKSSIICQKFYNYYEYREILNNISIAISNNDIKKLKLYKTQYKKYKKIFSEIYNLTF